MENIVIVTIDQDNSQELVALVEAAFAQVVMLFSQHLKTIDAKTYIGQGKVSEIKEYVSQHDVDGVVFSRQLSGSQIACLGEIFNCKVIDRSMLILDIFASRAKTPQAVLQVRLAQLKYQLPRLIGLRSNLSRSGGGIGSKGPGEQKLELDRRKIQKQISQIKQHLKKYAVSKALNRQRKIKSDMPIVALVGYTNAGKSTIFNRLMVQKDKQVFEKDMLFASLDVTTRIIRLADDQNALMVDTVGFIENLPLDLYDAFQATLQEIQDADVIVIVVDSTIQDPYQQLDVVKETIADYVQDKPQLVVFNKKDLASDKLMGGLFMSATNPKHLDRLKAEILLRIPNRV